MYPIAYVLIHEYCIEYPFNAGFVLKDPHRPRSSAHFTKDALDGIGGPYLPLEDGIGKEKAGEEFVKVLLQACDRRRIGFNPCIDPPPCRAPCSLQILCGIDRHKSLLHRLIIHPPHRVEDVPYLMRPAPLDRDKGIDEAHCPEEPLSSVHRDDPGSFSCQSPLSEIGTECLPLIGTL